MGPLRRRARAALAALALGTAGCSLPGDRDGVRALPFYERERPVTGAPSITDAALPLLHEEKSPGSIAFGLRPLFRSARTDRTERFEVLYPLYRTVDDAGAIATRLLPLYWHDELPRADGTGSDSDTMVLPILAWGSDPVDGGYFLLFPIGGTVKQKLLADRTTFVLFPLYAGTSTGEWRGHHLLWPLIHWGSDGKNRSSFRIFPLYMSSAKEGTYRRHSLLWPLVHWGEEDLHTRRPRSGWMIWPLYGREAGDDGYRSHAFLWPLFLWTDGPTVRERSLPYPLYRSRTDWIVKDDGTREMDSELLWLWPFYGRYDRREEEHSGYWMWPIVFWWDVKEGRIREEAFVVMPFWRSKTRTGEDGSADTWWKAWPFAQGERLPDGSGGWSALALLPWFSWPEFEASWGVFWELIRVRRGPDGSRSTDLLFSLVRSRRGPGEGHHGIPLLVRADRDATGSSWSILEGLLGGETGPGGGSSLRLLWFLRIPSGGRAAR
jgi:hypothetical protein